MSKYKVILVATLLLCFSFSNKVLAQNQNLTLNFNKALVSDVVKEIKAQTGLSVIYNSGDINPNSKISINSNNESLDVVMKKFLSNTSSDLSYEVKDNYIVISKGGKDTDAIIQANNEKRTIKGTVVDNNNEPLIGVNVVVEGTSTGTATDFDGNFTLAISENDSKLLFSYIGYESQLIDISQKQNVRVVMREDGELLDELVVTALGIKRETKSLSYNVQQVKSEEFTTVKDPNFMNSLAGKVAGVTINSGATGAGGASRVVMRGMKSISKDNNALYVIDGVPMFNTGSSGGEGAFGDMGGSDAVADLNPDDIESINMMTGPSAAALYGSAAANGVVLINTKAGKEGKTVVTVSNNTTFSNPYVMPKMQNRYGTSSGIFSWGDPTSKRYEPKDFFDTGSNVINAISVSTGTKKNQTYISGSTTNSNGILPNNSYDRYNLSGRNTTTFAEDKLVLDLGANYIIQSNKNMVSQGQYYNPLPSLYLFPRGDDFNELRLYERYDSALGYMKQYWPYGDASLSLQNPYWIQNRIVRQSSKKRYILNGSLQWNVAEWINVKGRFNFDNSDHRNRIKKHASTLTTFAGLSGGYEDEMIQERSYYMDALVNIDKSFDDFRLNANIGTSLQHSASQLIGYAGDLVQPNFFALNNIDYSANYKPLQEGYRDEIQSIFANLEVGWKDMAYLTLTGRNDWDSKLAGSDNSSFFYPSVGLSGLLTEMFELPKAISFAKVRGSYTMVASSFDRFLTNPGFEYNSQTHNWSNPTTYPATNLKPEKTKSWEVGLNTRFWDNKINFDVTYYHSNTSNQTFFVDIPSTSGYNKAIVQTGDIENKGVELALGFNDKWGSFTWHSNATLTFNDNKVARLAGGAINPVTNEPIVMDELKVGWLGKENVAPQVILTEGGSMTDIYVYNHLKTDNNGKIHVNAQTGGLAITTDDTPTKVGKLAPKFNLGWNNSFNYKGINLGVLLTARIGGLAYSATQGILDYYGASEVTADARDNGGIWINNGYVEADKYYQAIGTGEGGYGQYYLYSATNVRLQELSISYTLPKRVLNDVAQVTLGVVGRNLLMIYNKAPFDPELSASTSSNYYMNVDYFMQPSTRNIGLNLKLQF